MSDKRDDGKDNGKLLYCSFCGKSQHEVRKLIAGPSVFICDECVELCNDIIREEVEEKHASSGATEQIKLPTPKEILEILDQYVVGQSEPKKVLAVAKKAMKRKTGARGLRSILENVLLDTMYELPSMHGVTKVVIDSAAVNGESKPLLIFENTEKLSRRAGE